MAGDTWAKLLEVAQRNNAVIVHLTPGQRIKRPPRRRGRPRVRGAALFAHYKAYRPEIGGRPRCPAHRCGKRLKRDEIACSPDHAAKAQAEARALLAKIQET